jgi:hypothetical protein
MHLIQLSQNLSPYWFKWPKVTDVSKTLKFTFSIILVSTIIQSSIKKWTQTYGIFNGLTFVHVIYIKLTTCSSRCWILPLVFRHAWFWKNWNNRQLYSKLPETLFIQFHPYTGFHTEEFSVLNCTTYYWTKQI